MTSALASAQTTQKKQPLAPIQHLTPEAKAENQRKADLLRAKLLASRQNTPSNKQQNSLAATPTAKPKDIPSSKPANLPKQTPAVQSTNHNSQPKLEKTDSKMVKNNTEPSSATQSIPGLDALLKQGKAAADAQTAALAAQKTPGANEPAQNNVNGSSNTQGKQVKQDKPASAAPTMAEQTSHPTRPSNVSDAYYADLPAWLEMTGYHDAEYRNSTLRTYKARIELRYSAS